MNPRLPWFAYLLGLAMAALAIWPQAPSAAESLDTYLVFFRDPPATRFAAIEQVAQAKALGLTPTAATGKHRFSADSPAAERYVAYLDRQQDLVLADAAQRFGRALPPRFRYRYLSNGVALRLRPEEAAALRNLPGVAAVREDFKRRPLTDAGPAFIEAPLLWNGTVPGSGLQTKGEGVVIGVIDTGINASHPAFADIGGDGFNHSNPRGRRFGLCNQAGETRCNDKLIGIYDFVSEPDSQKGADIDGHGSHVASTAAGNFYVASGQSGLLPLNLSGVAPHANLIMYKACGTGDVDCPFSALANALDQATGDGVDVINYSIGGDARNPWADLGNSPDDAGLFLNARDAGIVGVVAAGNEGPTPGFLTSPGNAPWVITAANISSDRRFQNTLRNVQGSGLTAPRDFLGAGLTASLASRPIVHARDFGDADCNIGSDLDSPPTGASNPFAPGTFSGQIVICARGINARVAKGFNVKAAGAGGMVLVNTAAEGESIVADDHFLPTVHLGFASGSELTALVEAARQAGGGLSGDISDAERVFGGGDMLNFSSSRGPNPGFGGVLKPDLAAPGTEILAASKQGSGYAALSGTSMATPHIAGAAALLLSAHPQWSVSQVESALLATASPSIVLADGATPAHAVEGGAGRVRIASAVRAPLRLDISTNDFLAANPGLLGDPRRLNRPSLHDAECRDTCSFTRTVTDNGSGGNYQVLTEASDDAQISVQPVTFTLAPGGSQTLSISIDVQSDRATGHWIDGGVRLRNTSAAPDTLADFVLPVAVFATPGTLPATIELGTISGNASQITNLSGLVAMGDAGFAAAGTSILTPVALSLERDTIEPHNAFNNTGPFQQLFLLDAPAGTDPRGRIYAEARSNSTRDGRVFIGIDGNGNGLAEANEVLCQSLPKARLWRCATESDWSLPGTRYWVLVHNRDATSTAALAATVRIINVAMDADGEHGVVVSGPRRLAANAPIPLRIGWNLPQLRVGETAASFVRIGANHEQPDQAGIVPLFILRPNSSTPAAIVLDAGGDTVTLSLAAAQVHERIVIDVPGNAQSLTVSSAGSNGNIDLYLARATAPPTPPVFAPAPARGEAQGTSIHPGSNETITLTTPTLSPGRWYVTPVNAGGTPVSFTLSASLTTSGAITQPAANAWFNPDRDGHGIFLAKTDSAWVLSWYTFEADGKPTWYLASAPAPAPDAGSWSAPLGRFTWNGVESGAGSFGNAVGRVMLSFDGSGFSYSWLLFGEYGSEPFRAIGPTACAQDGAVLRSISGGWFDPNNPGWGLFAQSFINGIDANALYLFDQAGEPRWLFGSGSFPGPAEIPVFQISGFCPTCAFSPTTASAVGTLTRSYDSDQTGRHSIHASFVDGVPGVWNLDKPVSKLTGDVACGGNQ